MNAKEKKSFFGFGGEANVHIWGRPVLDQAQQTLRLDRYRARGRIRGRVRAAGRRGARGDAASAEGAGGKGHRRPQAVRRNAQKKIAAVIADLQKNEEGVRVAAEITRLRLADIAFDSKTLRVIAEAEGTINVYGDRAAGAVNGPRGGNRRVGEDARASCHHSFEPIGGHGDEVRHAHATVMPSNLNETLSLAR